MKQKIGGGFDGSSERTDSDAWFLKVLLKPEREIFKRHYMNI